MFNLIVALMGLGLLTFAFVAVINIVFDILDARSIQREKDKRWSTIIEQNRDFRRDF